MGGRVRRSFSEHTLDAAVGDDPHQRHGHVQARSRSTSLTNDSGIAAA